MQIRKRRRWNEQNEIKEVVDLCQENQVVLYQSVGLLEVFQVQEALETILIMSITVRSQETLFRKFAKRL